MKMSLADWLSKGWVSEHKTSYKEIAELLAITDRDLKDCQIIGLSTDAKLNIAYNAALQATTAALAAMGYRASLQGHHYRIIQSLAYTIGSDRAFINELNKFRKKRNISDYERAGAVSEQEAREMFSLAKNLRATVENWLIKNHPELMKE
jgi:hypothetical protein